MLPVISPRGGHGSRKTSVRGDRAHRVTGYGAGGGPSTSASGNRRQVHSCTTGANMEDEPVVAPPPSPLQDGTKSARVPQRVGRNRLEPSAHSANSRCPLRGGGSDADQLNDQRLARTSPVAKAAAPVRSARRYFPPSRPAVRCSTTTRTPSAPSTAASCGWLGGASRGYASGCRWSGRGGAWGGGRVRRAGAGRAGAVGLGAQELLQFDPPRRVAAPDRGRARQPCCVFGAATAAGRCTGWRSRSRWGCRRWRSSRCVRCARR